MYTPDAATDTFSTPVAPAAANATSDTAPSAPPDPTAGGSPAAAPAMPVAPNPGAGTPPPPSKATFAENFQRGINGPEYQANGQGQIQSTAPARTRSAGGILGSILSGALEGAVRGAGATTPEGARGRGAAVSAGIDASRKGALAADARARQIAQTNLENQQAATQAKVRQNMELAETAHITQVMNHEKEMEPGQLRAQDLSNQEAGLRLQGGQQKLLEDSVDFQDKMAQLGIPREVYTSHSPALSAQIPGAVGGQVRAIQNGQRGDANGVVVYPKAQMDAPLTAPVTYRTYDGAVDKDGVPIPTEHIMQPDGKLTANDFMDKYMAGRSQLYKMQQQIHASMTQQDQQAKIAESKGKAKESQAAAVKDYGEAFKAQQEGKKTEKELNLLNDLNPQGSEGKGGDSYLQSLPEGVRGVVQGIGEGRMTYSDRQLFDAKTGLPTATLQAVMKAYPDFQVQNAKTWQGTKDEYLGKGQTAKKVVAYNTAMEHAAAAYDKTNAIALNSPFSAEGKARDVDIDFVAQEIGNAISTGVLPQKTGDEIKSGLTSHIPYLAKSALKEAIKLLNDKTGEFQSKFEAGAPSKAVQVPNLMTNKAKSAYDHVMSDGKVAFNEAVQGQVPSGSIATTPQTQQPTTADPFFVK